MGFWGNFFKNPSEKTNTEREKATQERLGRQNSPGKENQEKAEETVSFTVSSDKKEDLLSLINSRAQDLIEEYQKKDYTKYSNIYKNERYVLKDNTWYADCEIIFYKNQKP